MVRLHSTLTRSRSRLSGSPVKYTLRDRSLPVGFQVNYLSIFAIHNHQRIIVRVRSNPHPYLYSGAIAIHFLATNALKHYFRGGSGSSNGIGSILVGGPCGQLEQARRIRG